MKQNLENLIAELNRMDFITSKQIYKDALKLFHTEIKPANRGHLVFVTDEQGNPIRHPIKMLDFQERPRFYQSEGKAEKIGLDGNNLEKEKVFLKNRETLKILVDLIRVIPNHTEENSSKRKRQNIKQRVGKQKRW